MNSRMLMLVASAVLIGAAALAQLRIAGLSPGGELSWTNSGIWRGYYNVESADSLSAPWNMLGTVADLDGTQTNRITFQVPFTNSQGFYRVEWLTPNALGVWDYRGYDSQGTLVITGLLSISSITLLSQSGYDLQGFRDLRYTGPETNAPWWLAPQPGTGYFRGNVSFNTAQCSLWWPTNCWDCGVGLTGDLGPNTYTGSWSSLPGNGHFTAVRQSSTNFVTNNP